MSERLTAIEGAQNLLTVLRRIETETEGEMTVLVEHKMRKTDNPLNDRLVQRRSALAVILCPDLPKLVVEHEAKRGIKCVAPYEPGPRTWGKRLGNSPLIEHNGQHYIGVWIKSSSHTFLVDGVAPTDEELGLINKYTAAKEGGLPYREYKLDSVVTLKLPVSAPVQPPVRIGVFLRAALQVPDCIEPLPKPMTGNYCAVIEDQTTGRVYDLLDLVVLGAKLLRGVP